MREVSLNAEIYFRNGKPNDPNAYIKFGTAYSNHLTGNILSPGFTGKDVARPTYSAEKKRYDEPWEKSLEDREAVMAAVRAAKSESGLEDELVIHILLSEVETI